MIGTILIIIAIAVIALLAGGLRLNQNFIMGPIDEGLRLESSATKTANFNGTAKDMGTGFAPGGVGLAMGAIVKPSAGDRSSSDETYAFVLEESSDNSTFTACGPSVSLAVAGTVFPTGSVCVPGFVSLQYVRCRLTVGGTTPSITYEAWLRPLSDL